MMRRRALLGGMVATAAMGLGAVLWRSGVVGPGREVLEAVREGVRTLPEGTLMTAAARAREPDVVALLADLLDEGVGPGEVRAHLVARMREDYRAGRVARVDGWVLSETELRLLALAAQR